MPAALADQAGEEHHAGAASGEGAWRRPLGPRQKAMMRLNLQATMLAPAAMLLPGARQKALMPSQMHLPRQMLLHGAPQKTLMSQMHLHRQAMLLLGAPQKALMSSQVDLASASCDALVRWRRAVGSAAHAAAGARRTCGQLGVQK